MTVPTYQYQCTECGEPLEVQQSFSEPSLTDCPSCSGRLRKVYNAVGVVFKGSGFYRNDSRGADPAASSDSSGEKSSGEKSSGDKTGSDSGKADSTKGESGGSKKASESSTSSSDSKSKATTPA